MLYHVIVVVVVDLLRRPSNKLVYPKDGSDHITVRAAHSEIEVDHQTCPLAQ